MLAKKSPSINEGLLKLIRRRPTLPRSHPRSTIGAKELNFRVRDGNGCLLFAIATENCKSYWVIWFVVFFVLKPNELNGPNKLNKHRIQSIQSKGTNEKIYGQASRPISTS